MSLQSVRNELYSIGISVSKKDMIFLWRELCSSCHFNAGLVDFVYFADKFVLLMWRGNALFISFIIVIHDTAACSAADSAMYSLSAVLRAIYVCRQLNQ